MFEKVVLLLITFTEFLSLSMSETVYLNDKWQLTNSRKSKLKTTFELIL